MVSVIALMAIVGAPGESTVEVLEFSAQWCGPCRTMVPAVERLKAAGFPLREIDVDRSPQLARQHNVTHLPTIVVMRDGREIGRRVGARSYIELARWFRQLNVTPRGGLDVPPPPVTRGQSPDVDQRPPIPAPARSMPREEAAPASGFPSAPRTNAVDSQAAARQALAATVRLRVEDGQGYSFGTGTIIDIAGPRALIVTCGHIFRDSRGKGTITVDLFTDGTPRSLPGQLLAYEADRRDIGFVVIEPGVSIRPVRVASHSSVLRVGMPAFSIGCNKGDSPSVQQTRVTALNRYAHGPNVEIAGMPVDGRSGGGLFTSDGQLIGICNAADPQENEGIYASLPLIHEHLTKLGLARVYAPSQEDVPRFAQRDNEPGDEHDSAARDGASTRTPARQRRGADVPGGLNSSQELICVVRDPQTGQQRVIVIARPTDALIRQLDAASHSPLPDAMVGDKRPRPIGSNGPIMRAQSER